MNTYTIPLSIHTKKEIQYIFMLAQLGYKQKVVRSGRDVPDGTCLAHKIKLKNNWSNEV